MKKNPLYIIIISVIAVTLFVTIITYIFNTEFREFIDMHILGKEITQEDVIQIALDSDESKNIYTYDKYITILEENKLKVYTHSTKPDFELDVNISNPVYSSNNRYLAIGEKDGQKICLISGQNIVWQKEIEGNILKINVNKNGYVSVIVSTSAYKTVVITFDSNGKEMFDTYLSATYALDTDISNDNKYLAIAEANTTGAILKSSVKIISIEKAEKSPYESIIHTYSSNNNDIIINIEFQDKNNLVCSYDTYVEIVKDGEKITKYEFNNDTMFSDINLNNNIMFIKKQSTGILQTEYRIDITNTNTHKTNIYTVDSVPKAVYCFEDTIALNIGTEVQFINANGWLIKKYTSNQEIKEVSLSNNKAGIIYKDKLEIIDL